MSCDERRLVAFLNGQLAEEDEHAFDEHLLTCEACWLAVRTDRAGRHALDQLRVPAPPGAGDRVTSSIRLAHTRPGSETPQTSHSRLHRYGLRAVHFRTRRIVAAAAVTVALVGSALGWALDNGQASDPPQIARVVAMMSPRVADAPALRAGEHFDVAGQRLTVRSYRVEGTVVLVATSARPFPMPATSHVLSGSSRSAWMAAEGPLAMYGVNQPAGSRATSMFLVAAVPMAQLPEVAARLHLI